MTATESAAPVVLPDDDALLRAQTGKRAAVFSLTWLAYATYYFGRKGFSVVKTTLQERYGLSVGILGWIDTGYLAAYAIGQFCNGAIGDRIGSRRLIGFGMLAAAASCALFGFSATGAMFLLAFILDGYFQSTGWPGCVKAMGAWFTAKERGTVMGMWSTCYQIGGLAAGLAVTFLLTHYGWRSAFFVPAIMIAVVGVLVLMFLPTRETQKRSAAVEVLGEIPNAAPADGSYFALVRSPVLWSLGAAYFCLKLIRYSLLFWLPYYLDKQLHYSKSQAGYQSVSFEVGGVLGAVAIGYISDKYFPGRRRLIAAVMTAALAAALLLYIQISPISMVLNFAGMALVGFCLFGPDTIICGAAAQDLGGKHNVAKAAGFINGIGSVGAVFQGVVTTSVTKSSYGWNGLLYLFVAMAIVSSIALLIGKRPAPQA